MQSLHYDNNIILVLHYWYLISLMGNVVCCTKLRLLEQNFNCFFFLKKQSVEYSHWKPKIEKKNDKITHVKQLCIDKALMYIMIPQMRENHSKYCESPLTKSKINWKIVCF